MQYCRIKIETAERGCVYQKDFDAQHIFGPLVRLFAGELVNNNLVQEGEHYNANIVPRYETTMSQTPIVRVDHALASEQLPDWLNLALNGNAQAETALTFFTMELRFRESGVIYAQDMSVLVLEHIWTNLQTALVKMHVLAAGDQYMPKVYFRSDDQADFTREIFHVMQSADEPLIELVEVEAEPPALPVKSPAEFDVLATETVTGASAVELVAPDEARQADVQIYLRQATYEALQAIARQDVQVEQGGVLVGHIYRHADNAAHYLVEITDHIPAQDAAANIAEFHYDFDVWQSLLAQLRTSYPDKRMVGWYHTHLLKMALSADQDEPTTDLFFSEQDRFMHRQFFADPYYVAMVLGAAGNAVFFRWFGDRISCNQQFFLI